MEAKVREAITAAPMAERLTMGKQLVEILTHFWNEQSKSHYPADESSLWDCHPAGFKSAPCATQSPAQSTASDGKSAWW
jgi:hypothetical protein